MTEFLLHEQREDDSQGGGEVLKQLVPQPLPFVLAHTGFKHHSGAAHRPVRERWLEGDPDVRFVTTWVGAGTPRFFFA